MAEKRQRPEYPLNNNRHERYCTGLVAGMEKKDAYYAAGFEGNSPWQCVHNIEKRPEVQARLEYLWDKLLRSTAQIISIDRNQLANESQAIYTRAMAGTPTLDREGNLVKYTPEGSDEEVVLSKPDLSAANRSIEVRGKLFGLMQDVKVDKREEADLKSLSREELIAKITAKADAIDPNRRKRSSAQEPETKELQPEVEGEEVPVTLQ